MADEQQNRTPQETAQDMSEQQQLRLQKLNRLAEAGQNPYEITTYDRTHLCSAILKMCIRDRSWTCAALSAIIL